MIPDEKWLAAVMASESNDERHWPYIGWVVRNRVEARGFRKTYAGVVRQPDQFSYWNATAQLSDEEAYAAAKSDTRRITPLLKNAEEYARWILAAPRAEAPVSADTFYFYSPRSMLPPGRMPAWFKKLYRFVPPGIDPWYFIFGAESAPDTLG